jgi:hypothetical protein
MPGNEAPHAGRVTNGWVEPADSLLDKVRIEEADNCDPLRVEVCLQTPVRKGVVSWRMHFVISVRSRKLFGAILRRAFSPM